MTGSAVRTPRASPESESVVDILDRADRAVDAVLTPVTSKEGLSREAWRVLLLLSRGGGRSMGEIAEHAAIPNPTATRVVDRLVSQQLAYRRNDTNDRRRVLVHLAAGGRQTVERVSQQLEDLVESAITLLSATESEVATLLTELTDSLDQVLEDEAAAGEQSQS
ncbi:MAG: MarR family winged helix-turn-helix transcriptional regulator [Actinomycetota bacterium]|nr:MarR family winged helix-turn-helix transcriptional regulator [Actinomycetota bacterium]